MNKFNPLHAGCHTELPREIKMKRAIITVQILSNACFAWSVVTALHPVKKHTERALFYSAKSHRHPISMTLNQIENLNDISINVYIIEKQKEILLLRLIIRKRGKHVNFLYVQDLCNDNTGHFAWIKDVPPRGLDTNQ